MIATIRTNKGKALKEITTDDSWTEGMLLTQLAQVLTELFIQSRYKRKDFTIPELGIDAEIEKVVYKNYKYRILFKKDGKLMPKCPFIIPTKYYEDFIEKIRAYNATHLLDD